jgi:hypothetical protein
MFIFCLFIVRFFLSDQSEMSEYIVSFSRVEERYFEYFSIYFLSIQKRSNFLFFDCLLNIVWNLNLSKK